MNSEITALSIKRTRRQVLHIYKQRNLSCTRRKESASGRFRSAVKYDHCVLTSAAGSDAYDCHRFFVKITEGAHKYENARIINIILQSLFAKKFDIALKYIFQMIYD